MRAEKERSECDEIVSSTDLHLKGIFGKTSIFHAAPSSDGAAELKALQKEKNIAGKTYEAHNRHQAKTVWLRVRGRR